MFCELSKNVQNADRDCKTNQSSVYNKIYDNALVNIYDLLHINSTH